MPDIGGGQRGRFPAAARTPRGARCSFGDPELGEQPGPLRAELSTGAVARAVEADRHVHRDRAVDEHEHPVGEQDRLVDVMGDQQDRRMVPRAQVLSRACMRVLVSASSAPNGSSSSIGG
jgi:hypothetical protein